MSTQFLKKSILMSRSTRDDLLFSPTHITIQNFTIKLLLPIFKIRGHEDKDKK